MSRIEKKLISGINRVYIIEYFISICSSYDNQGNFKGANWEVEVAKEEYRKLGSIELPSTQIVFRANEDLVNQMVDRFRIKFLSAGG
ncbi:hypothetical protein R9X47_26070 [Wukongibacter baidiensis]|uniref:hypothetical protein n=1 Tax=Wukongibacter baidiensis TaxID=1723361 RepID=UPI003D7FFAC9